jgi:Xaa-Pro aminopeptidase
MGQIVQCPNSRLIISKTKKIFLISKIHKTEKLIKDKIIKSKEVIDIKKFHQEIVKLNGKNFIIDNKSCSIFYEDIIKSKFKIVKREDPTYLLNLLKIKQRLIIRLILILLMV